MDKVFTGTVTVQSLFCESIPSGWFGGIIFFRVGKTLEAVQFWEKYLATG